MGHSGRPLVLRLWLEQQRIRTKATDADTTMFVSIGARSGGIRSCSWFSRIPSPSTLAIAERLASRLEPLWRSRCSARLP